MTAQTDPWWRRHRRLLVAAGAVVVALVVLVVVLVVRREPDPVDEPVTASTLDGYVLRGSLVGTDAFAGEVEAAADEWRHEDVGNQEEPPDPDERIEVLWAGDLSVEDLGTATRYGLRADEDSPGGRRIVVLRSGDHVATFRAPLEDGGERSEPFRIDEDVDGRCLECSAAVGVADELTLLAGDGTEEPTVEAAFPFGYGDDPEPTVVEVPVVDGLLVAQDGGAMLRDSVRAVPRADDPAGLVFTTGGVVVPTDAEALWSRLTTPATAPTTWASLRDAYADAYADGRSDSVPYAELWDGPTLSDGRTLAVVAVVADGPAPRYGGPWTVSATTERTGVDVDEVSRRDGWDDVLETTVLGTGSVDGSPNVAPDVPPLVAHWYGTDGDAGTTPELVVVGPDEITSIDVLAADGGASVDGSSTTWARPDPAGWVRDPSFVEDVSPADLPSVVVVGRTADGTPALPLTVP